MKTLKSVLVVALVAFCSVIFNFNTAFAQDFVAINPAPAIIVEYPGATVFSDRELTVSWSAYGGIGGRLGIVLEGETRASDVVLVDYRDSEYEYFYDASRTLEIPENVPAGKYRLLVSIFGSFPTTITSGESSLFTVTSAPPVLVIVSPETNVTWTAGSAHDVKFYTEGNLQYPSIQLVSLGRDRQVYYITNLNDVSGVDGVISAGVFIPSTIPPGDYRLQVISYILPDWEPAVAIGHPTISIKSAITFPSNGKPLIAGHAYTFKWNSGGLQDAGQYDLYLAGPGLMYGELYLGTAPATKGQVRRIIPFQDGKNYNGTKHYIPNGQYQIVLRSDRGSYIMSTYTVVNHKTTANNNNNGNGGGGGTIGVAKGIRQ